jgi:twinkle protein
LLQFDESFCQRIRDELRNELQSTSIKLQTFPRLARLIRGFRPGELTIFTGPTGSGKTTVLSQMSLDYCFQGIKTLWGSFEIKHTRLARIMIQQVAAQSLFNDENENLSPNGEIMSQPSNSQQILKEDVINQAQRVLQNSPIFFMDYFGSTPLESIIESMSRAVSEHQIQHIVLDNLQFMLSGQHSGGSFDKFDLTDRTVSALRSFATSKNVHITLVIHPRKEMDDTPLGLASVSGTAKATQEADNVIILQKVGESRYIDVKKNRFDGLVGSVPIKFDADARLILESTHNKQAYGTNNSEQAEAKI